MSEVVYKLTLEPEDTETRTVYVVDGTGLPEVTEENSGDAFDVILSDNEGYYLDEFEVISLEDIPEGERPYSFG